MVHTHQRFDSLICHETQKHIEACPQCGLYSRSRTGHLGRYISVQPQSTDRYAMKWDGEWHVTISPSQRCWYSSTFLCSLFRSSTTCFTQKFWQLLHDLPHRYRECDPQS